jgi:hypothetical protein
MAEIAREKFQELTEIALVGRDTSGRSCALVCEVIEPSRGGANEIIRKRQLTLGGEQTCDRVLSHGNNPCCVEGPFYVANERPPFVCPDEA